MTTSQPNETPEPTPEPSVDQPAGQADASANGDQDRGRPSPQDSPRTDHAADNGDDEPLEEDADGDQGADDTDTDADDELEQADDEVPAEAQDLAAEAQDVAAEAQDDEEKIELQWYILKVQVNREDSIRDALWRRVKMYNLEPYFDEIIVPTEDVAEFTKAGKRRIVKRKLFPGYLMVHMMINDDTWFAVRETPGIGDFTGAAGKPTPMEAREVERYTRKPTDLEEEGQPIKTSIPFKPGDRVRVKEGYFQNFEGEVKTVDETHGRVTVMISIFGRPTPVELEHWQMESV